jgi:hypothetical protein
MPKTLNVQVSVKDAELYQALSNAVLEILRDERIPLDVRDEYLRKLMPLLGLEYEE